MNALEKLGYEVDMVHGVPRYSVREDKDTVHYIIFVAKHAVSCRTVRKQTSEQPTVEPLKMEIQELKAILELMEETK